MSVDRPDPAAGPPTPDTLVANPVVSLDDPRAITILTTEHWSLLSARSLAYNEAFVRGGMFLTFLSMSFVALALFSSAMSFGDEFLTVAAVLLAFDFVIGLTTYGAATAARPLPDAACAGGGCIHRGRRSPLTSPPPAGRRAPSGPLSRDRWPPSLRSGCHMRPAPSPATLCMGIHTGLNRRTRGTLQ